LLNHVSRREDIRYERSFLTLDLSEEQKEEEEEEEDLDYH
jgi:hypothetical protein